MHLTLFFAPFLLWQPLVGAVITGDRPTNVTFCDFYTQKTIGDNTAANQQLLAALVLHSALLGNYSKYNTVPVNDFTGALKPREFQGVYVDLNVYFNGAFASANTGKGKGEAVNFWDDGGLAVALQSKPGNGNVTSNQYRFFFNVYNYFATFLQCSHLGSKELPGYTGKASMYEVHKYMYLNKAEMGYFIDQAVKGLKSFGFSEADAQFVNMTLVTKFHKRCAPAEPIIPATAGPQLQPICTAPDCMLAPNDTCSIYDKVSSPTVANITLAGNYSKTADGRTSLNSSTTTTPSSSPSASTKASGVSSVFNTACISRILPISGGIAAAFAFGLI